MSVDCLARIKETSQHPTPPTTHDLLLLADWIPQWAEWGTVQLNLRLAALSNDTDIYCLTKGNQSMLRCLQHGFSKAHLKTLPPTPHHLRSTHNLYCTKYTLFWWQDRRTTDHPSWYCFPAWIELACPRPQQTGQDTCKAKIWRENMLLVTIIAKRNQ